MTKLLEIRDKAIKFYGEYSTYVFPVVKFVFALVTFLLINQKGGFLSNIFVLFPLHYSIYLCIFYLGYHAHRNMISAFLACFAGKNAAIGRSIRQDNYNTGETNEATV